MKIEVGSICETGNVRKENQDRMGVSSVALGNLYIVADGMGGHKAGGLAAELTVEGLQKHVGEADAGASVEKVFESAFERVNREIYRKSHGGDPDIEGMGSTALVLLITDRIARLAHVGDSRAYLYRNRRLKQLTRDHTLVQQMVEAGMLSPEKAEQHPDASVLSQAMGAHPDVDVEISAPLSIEEGDQIVLCSDGLSGFVTDLEIEQVLQGEDAVQDTAKTLADLALVKGGNDNITIQLIRCSGNMKEH
jgi:PPM family protein phosphatase